MKLRRALDSEKAQRLTFVAMTSFRKPPPRRYRPSYSIFANYSGSADRQHQTEWFITKGKQVPIQDSNEHQHHSHILHAARVLRTPDPLHPLQGHSNF